MYNQPIFFKKNRVSRVYIGGKLFDDFLADGSTDGFYPEEWIASAVSALSSLGESEGVSVTEDSDNFAEILRKGGNDIVGPRGKMRILVKYLDSAIRLPAQAHPDREFSRKHFNSEYGKTESWVILGVREGAKLYFGFKDGVSEEDFRAAIAASEHDKDAMQELMEVITPKVGDVYLVPAKTIHAIGAGCLILEVQEPTDFTIQPERWCGDYRLSDEQMYLGLSLDDAVDCFKLGTSSSPRIEPVVVTSDSGLRKESLIGKKHTPCFEINRILLAGASYTLSVDDSYAVYIVTDGCVTLRGEGYERSLRRGDYFFMPYSAMGKYSVSGNATLVECY